MNYKNGPQYHSHLYSAMRLYGLENFSFEVIEECENALLNEREIYWIEVFDSYNTGYNVTLGGDAGKARTSERIKMICDLWRDNMTIKEIVDQTELSCATVSSILRGNEPSYNVDENYYRVLTKRAIKNKMRVCQYSLTGELINIFNTVRDAENATNTPSNGIHSCCVNLKRSSGGFLWCYEKDAPPNRYDYVPGESKKKAVKQYDLLGNYIATYDSMTEAERATGCQSNSISRACTTKSGRVGDYQWRFETDEDPGRLQNHSLGFAIAQYSLNGELIAIHQSGVSAAKAVGLQSPGVIYSCCKGDLYSAAGFQWRYFDDDPPGVYKYKDSNYNAKAVSQFSLNGDYINTYSSIHDAFCATGIPAQRICACCRGNSNTTHGFQWRYANDEPPGHYVKPKAPHAVSVNQYDMDHNLIKTYESIKVASEATGISSSCISAACSKRSKTGFSHGFYWERVA